MKGNRKPADWPLFKLMGEFNHTNEEHFVMIQGEDYVSSPAAAELESSRACKTFIQSA